jgi:hypothetical protein
VATPQKREVDVEAFVARMGDPRVRQSLNYVSMSEPLCLLSREVVSADNGVFLARPETPMHSDYVPCLEYMSQVGFFVGTGSRLYEAYDETRLARPQTLLGQYLRKNPITDADFGRMANAFLANQFVDARLAFSMMQRWAHGATNTTLPFELLERISVERPLSVTEELRLAPRHAMLMEQASKDIASLHFYERVLMRAYRAKRSVYYLPETERLQEVLKTLLERDPTHARVFKLHAAELAWDRGDDETCMRLGTEALDPRKGGPVTFALDEFAPRQILYCMIETSLRRGNVDLARDLASQARAGGYLMVGEFHFAPLEMICRKAETSGDPRVAALK